MDGINLPTNVDWFNALLLPILVAVITGIIVGHAEGRIDSSKSATYIFSAILCTVVFSLIWYNIIGVFYFLWGRSAEPDGGCRVAASLYEKAVVWNPKISDARTKLVSCYTSLNRGDELVTILEPLGRSLSDSPRYWQDMASVYYANRDYQKMIRSVAKSADLEPKNSEWITALGELLHRDLRYSEEEAVLRTVRTHNGSDDMAVFWLAWSLYEQTKLNDAFYHFEECIKRFASGYNLGRCHAGRGFALLKMGRFEDAHAAFQQALTIEPNQEDVKTALDQLP